MIYALPLVFSSPFTFGNGRIDHFNDLFNDLLKDIDYSRIEIIKGLTDKGQFQYLTNLKGPHVGNYRYKTQFLSLR